MYAFPLTLRFKRISLATQITVFDANGEQIMYARQKMLKLKEEIVVYRDSSRSERLYGIAANRVLDFSTQYNFTDLYANQLGAVKRRGRRSLWKAYYEIFRDRNVVMTITEDDAWVKVMDALFGEIPVIGLLSGYLFNPTYSVTRVVDGQKLVSIKKQPALWESVFIIDEMIDIADATETDVILSIITMVFLERERG